MSRGLFGNLGTSHPVVDLQRYKDGRAQGLTPGEAEEAATTSPGTGRIFEGYRPHRKQKEIHTCGARILSVCAGRRSGKTFAGGREFLRRVFRDFAKFRKNGGQWRHPGKLGPEVNPALDYWCVAPTYPLGTYQRREIFDVLGGPQGPLVLNYNRSINELWLAGGIRISFKSADRPKWLVGPGLDGIWIDEAARLKAEAWSDNLRPTLSDTGGWAIMTSTPLGKNWWHRDVWQKTQLTTDTTKRDSQYHAVHFTTADNTAVPRLIEEAKRAKRELATPIYRRNYEADFDAFKGKVFGDFLDDATHVVGEIPWHKIERRIAGVDWGHKNPGCQLEIGIDSDGGAWVLREDHRAGLTVAPPTHNPDAPCWVQRFKAAKRRGTEVWWADPSGSEHIDACRREDIRMKPAHNAVGPGIDAVAAMLTPATPKGTQGRAEPGLKIHRTCVNLRRQLSSYRWQDDKEKPEKTDDHAVDALRYAIYSEHRDGGGISRLDWSIFDRFKGSA